MTISMEEHLLNGLTDPEPSIRMTARLISTGFVELLDKWVLAEVERGEDMSMIMQVMTEAMFSRAAWIAAAPLRTIQDEELRALAVERVLENLQKVYGYTVRDTVLHSANHRAINDEAQ